MLAQWFFTALALVLGVLWSQWRWKFYDRGQQQREARTRIVRLHTVGPGERQDVELAGQLLTASIVLAPDFIQMLLAGFQKIFGGRVTAYDGVLRRARTEALLRLKEQALALGSRQIFRLRFETTMIENSPGNKRGVVAVEFVAYGTALFGSESAH